MQVFSLFQTIYGFFKKISEDSVNAFSAQAAFFIILSAFPFLMFLLTLIQYLPLTETDLMAFLLSVMPPFLTSLAQDIFNEIYHESSGTIISITVMTALWSASRGFLAIIHGLNSVYTIHETRNYVHLRLLSSLYTLLFAIMLIITLGLFAFGNTIYIALIDEFPWMSDFALSVISLRTIVGLLLLAFFFLALFLVIPNRDSSILQELPGAVIASCGWVLFSYLYSFYIQNFSNISYMYGSLTAVVLLMLWLYFCMYILFLGAEINVFIQHYLGHR